MATFVVQYRPPGRRGAPPARALLQWTAAVLTLEAAGRARLQRRFASPPVARLWHVAIYNLPVQRAVYAPCCWSPLDRQPLPPTLYPISFLVEPAYSCYLLTASLSPVCWQNRSTVEISPEIHSALAISWPWKALKLSEGPEKVVKIEQNMGK